MRRGSLIVEYRARTDALDETLELSAGGGLVDISGHAPLGEASEEYARLEESVVGLVGSVARRSRSPTRSAP